MPQLAPRLAVPFGMNDACRTNVLYAAAALGLIVLVIIMSLIVGASTTETRKPSKHFDKRLRELVAEAGRWSDTSKSDTNPLLSVVHATYGSAYLNVARTMASDVDIERACNIRLDEFAGALTDTQQHAMRNVTTRCKELDAPGIVSLNTGWLSLS